MQFEDTLSYDELSIGSEEDATLDKVEFSFIKNIENQITNLYGDFTGIVDSETDFIDEYIKTIISGDSSLSIDDFENICNTSGMEIEYDIITHGIIDIMRDNIGVKFDIERENLYFKDVYDVYITLVLSLRSTIEKATRQYYMNIGTKKDILTLEDVSDYCLSDEFDSDEFFKIAYKMIESESLMNIVEKIDDTTIVIENETFINYIYKFVTGVMF